MIRSIGLAVSQVVCSIVLAQSPAKKEDFYQTAAFQTSLISGLIPIGLIMGISLLWSKLRK